jgi:hypothetical protein
MREVMDIPDFSELLYGGLSYSFDKRLEFVNSEYNKITATSLAIIVSAPLSLVMMRCTRAVFCTAPSTVILCSPVVLCLLSAVDWGMLRFRFAHASPFDAAAELRRLAWHVILRVCAAASRARGQRHQKSPPSAATVSA